MFGYKKEIFECCITHVDNNIAFVVLTNLDTDEISTMEIPKEDLYKFNINFKERIVFNLTFKYFLGWEKIYMEPIVSKIYAKEEFENICKKYEEKYRTV